MTNERPKDGGVADLPAGRPVQAARGGEFERIMEGLQETELELAAIYRRTVVRGYRETPRTIELDRMRGAVLKAIEELRKHE